LRPQVSEAVDDVLAKALNPQARRRWTSASTFAIALCRALERQPADHQVAPLEVDDPVKQAEAIMTPTTGIELQEVRELGASGFSLPAVPLEDRLIVGQVRAAHLRVLTKLLQHHVGEGGMARLLNTEPALAHAFSSTLAPLSWIELTDLIAALEHAKSLLPNQLVPRKVGRGTMSATFARLFGADPSRMPPETVLSALPTFWDRYHAWGGVRVDVHPGMADVELDGFSGSTDVCALVGSELERIVELTGATAVGATHTACACTGDALCSFRLTWTDAPA
jgi:hypothetical protein